MEQSKIEKSINVNKIDQSLFKKYEVKKGLRNADGTGVCVGLTKIADVVGYKWENNKKIDCEGDLFYRGISIKEITEAHYNKKRVDGFEEVCFLLLHGYIPDKKELEQFRNELNKYFELPHDYVEMNILRMPVENVMNKLQQAVLALYTYDEKAESDDIREIVEKGYSLLAKLPQISVYTYQAKRHHFYHESLFLHYMRKDYTIAENILNMLRKDNCYTHEEASLLDLLLMLHADHGGGNNSTFTSVVVASTGTDLYSSISASIGAMKGPKHGGANLAVCGMMKEVIETIGYTQEKEKVDEILKHILNHDFYDRSGLIYGIGHAVYTLSDPRCEILKARARDLAKTKGKEKEFAFYELFEQCAKQMIYKEKGIHVCANIDFYSGFVYEMLEIPQDLYTPLFVCARVVGWVAHTIENRLNDGRIMRPATKYVGEIKHYQEGNGEDERNNRI